MFIILYSIKQNSKFKTIILSQRVDKFAHLHVIKMVSTEATNSMSPIYLVLEKFPIDDLINNFVVTCHFLFKQHTNLYIK